MGVAFVYVWYFVVPLARVIGAVFLIVRRRALQPSLPSWRMKLWLAGMIAVLLWTLPSVLQLGLAHLPDSALDCIAPLLNPPLVQGFLLLCLAGVLLSFGKGWARA